MENFSLTAAVSANDGSARCDSQAKFCTMRFGISQQWTVCPVATGRRGQAWAPSRPRVRARSTSRRSAAENGVPVLLLLCKQRQFAEFAHKQQCKNNDRMQAIHTPPAASLFCISPPCNARRGPRRFHNPRQKRNCPFPARIATQAAVINTTPNTCTPRLP
jgi:hypothetical protein